MTRKGMTAILAAATLSLSSGCASTWSRTTSFFRPHPGPDAENVESEVAAAESKAKSPKDESLSKEFREAQKTFKNTERTMLAWARYQEDIGEYAEARNKYRELQIAYPKNIESHLGMARIEMLTGRTEQAEQLLTDLAKKHPDNPDILVELGKMYSQQEDWDKAIRAFEDASDMNPDHQGYRYELGIALARAGQFDAALSHLTFAVGAPAAHYNIGYILHDKGNDSDAVEWFENALAMHPDKQTEQKSKSMLAQLQSDWASAVEYSSVARQRPEPRPADRTSATQQIASQFSPAAADGGRGVQLPIVTAGRSFDGQPLPVVSTQPQSTPAGPAAQGSLLNTVSYSSPETTGRAKLTLNEPPQWHGPSSPPQSLQQAAPVSQTDPPLWRARKN